MKNEAPQQYLLKVDNLKKHFFMGKKSMFSKEQLIVKALDGVSFELKRGETLGIVGESGCGKSTMGRAILRLHEPTSGHIEFEGQDLMKLSNKKLRQKRKDLQIIFQDPYGSLNQRMTVGSMLAEIVNTHKLVPKKEVNEYVYRVLEEVGLKKEHYYRFPHEFSGGQRQRVGIARALCVDPKLIVCDEAVSALDVSVQSQILNLLQRLKKERELTYIFISHDLSVVKHISNRVAVMYLGKIIELADNKELFKNPKHPYTKALLSAVPIVGQTNKAERVILKGDIPSAFEIPTGCRFHTRCPIATDKCKVDDPEFREVSKNHFSACHYS
ncbi:ABC transporter ATP-binding protein [Sporosarcina sp. FA9]|uniref:ABC transporter ATP-binding protein n=1 Tax=Sporosarcina sp. FA9 TaxID=3413030 RepID=UPI003F659E98